MIRNIRYVFVRDEKALPEENKLLLCLNTGIAPPAASEDGGSENKTQLEVRKGMDAKPTAYIFERFYGKPFVEITQADIGNTEELDWGEDVGGEELV